MIGAMTTLERAEAAEHAMSHVPAAGNLQSSQAAERIPLAS